MATQYSNKPIVTNGLVYALDFGNQKSYVSGSSSARSLVFNPTPATFQTVPAGDYQGLAAAYSVRKVVSSYTGSAMMIQSASVSQSIGFDSNGNLDTASIAAFAGSGNAFVKIWYDQSGNGRDATQTTLANQPKIYSGSQGSIISKNGRPALEFDGTNDRFLMTYQWANKPFDFFAVVQLFQDRVASFLSEGQDVGQYLGLGTGGTGFPGAPKFALIHSTVNVQNFSSFYSNNVQYLANYFSTNGVVSNSVNASFKLNNGNTETITGFSVTNTNSNSTIGSAESRDYLSGTLQELILYSSNRSSNRTEISNNINSYFSIYSPLPDSPIPGFTPGLLNFQSPDALVTNQTFPGFSYDRGNSTIMYVGETKGTSSLFTQDTNLSVITTTSSVGFGSTSNNLGRTYPVSGLKHVTLRFSSGSVDCFINGLPVPANSVFPTGSSVAGGKFAIPVYTGSLGLFQVYNRPLTGDEIWSNYQLTAPRYGLGAVQNKPYTLDDNAYLFLSQSGITDPIITGSINTFVLGLKSASLWDKMIAIYPFVGTGSVGVNLTGSHRWNLKEPSLVTYPLTFTGSWNGSVSGSTPSGSNTNITAGGTTPSTYYPNYSTSSAHISILSYDTPTSSSFLAGTGIDTETAVSTLAGDYGTPAAAYSVRKVRTAYSGALMDVRRSIDNVTSSIGYVSNGDLDTGSLLDFVLPGRPTLPGAYSGLAAAYSLRKVSASYSGNAIEVRRSSDNVSQSIGFDASGNLDTVSLNRFAATGSGILAGNYSGLAAAYSLRRITSSYSGFAIQVQSASATQNIGFDSFGNLDTGSLLTFAGSGNAFVRVWYDQSGNNNHISQSTTALQPQIVSNGSVTLLNNRPAVTFTSSYLRALTYNAGSPSIFFVAQPNGTTINGLFDSAPGTPDLIRSFSGFWEWWNRNPSMSVSLTPSANYVMSFIHTLAPNRVINWTQNGVFQIQVSSSSTTPAAWLTPTIGSNNTNEQYYNGKLSEFIIYSSSQAANRTYIENNINSYYNIYIPSGTFSEDTYVSTWYDQSGNNRHATQTTASYQPLIVASGSLLTDNGRPTLQFRNALNQQFQIPVISNAKSVFLSLNKLVGTSNFTFYLGNSTGANDYHPDSGVEANYLSSVYAASSVINGVNKLNGVTVNLTTVSQSAGLKLLSFINQGTSTIDHLFGQATSLYPSFVRSWDGNGSEVLIYDTDKTSDRSFIENNISSYYSVSSPNDGFVARWYDQSGNNNHASQTTQANQPTIVLSGSVLTINTKPGVYFDGVNDRMTFSQIQGVTGMTLISIHKYDTISLSSAFYDSSDTLTAYNGSFIQDMSIGGRVGKAQIYFEDGTSRVLQGASIVTGSQYLQLGYVSTTSTGISVNGNLTTGSGAINNTIVTGIAQHGGSPYFQGNTQELLVYTTNQSVNREAIEYGINSYYNIYPQTSSFTTSSFTIKATPTGITGAINNQPLNGISSTGPLGFITVSRTGSNALTIARNGVTSSFTVPASGALSTGIYLGASNYNGMTVGSSPYNISFASVGTGLNGIDVRNYSLLVNKLQYDLGRAAIMNRYTTGSVGFSVRKLNARYTGSALQVRRTSDNTTRDIGFINNDLDTASLLSFVGGSSGFVTVWYDQSGNNRHISQSAAANQPQIVNSGSLLTAGSRPALLFNTSSMQGGAATSLTEATSYTVYFPLDDLGYTGWYVNGGGDIYWRYAPGSGEGYIQLFSSTRRDNFPQSMPTYGHTLFSTYHTSSTMNVVINNGTMQTETSRAFNSGSEYVVGGINTGAGYLYGYMQEILVLPQYNTSSGALDRQEINSYYNIY